MKYTHFTKEITGSNNKTDFEAIFLTFGLVLVGIGILYLVIINLMR